MPGHIWIFEIYVADFRIQLQCYILSPQKISEDCGSTLCVCGSSLDNLLDPMWGIWQYWQYDIFPNDRYMIWYMWTCNRTKQIWHAIAWDPGILATKLKRLSCVLRSDSLASLASSVKDEAAAEWNNRPGCRSTKVLERLGVEDTKSRSSCQVTNYQLRIDSVITCVLVFPVLPHVQHNWT